MLYKFKLKNREFKYVTMDEEGYKFLSEDPILKEMPILDNLREHSTSGAAVFQKWYRDVANKPYQETIYVHKILAEKFMSPRPSPQHRYVVHLNGDRLDNRLENLIWCTRSELNRYCRYESESGYRGVRKEKDKFRALIYIDGKPTHIGMYDTAEEAAQAYNVAAIEHGLIKREVNIIKKPSSKNKTVVAEKVKKKAKK